MNSNLKIIICWNILVTIANNKLLSRSTKMGRYIEVMQYVMASLELEGNKLCISNLYKREMEKEPQAHLIALNVSK